MNRFSGRAADKELKVIARNFKSANDAITKLGLAEKELSTVLNVLDAAYAARQKEIVLKQFQPMIIVNNQPSAEEIFATGEEEVTDNIDLGTTSTVTEEV